MVSLKGIINRFGPMRRDAEVNLEDEIRDIETETRNLDREKGELQRELSGMAARRMELMREDEVKKILAMDDRAATIHVCLEMNDQAREVLATRHGHVRQAQHRVRLANFLSTAVDLAQQRLKTYRAAMEARNAEARHREKMSSEGFEAYTRYLPDAFHMFGEPELQNVESTIESVRRQIARLESTPLMPQALTPVAGNMAKAAEPQQPKAATAPAIELTRLSVVEPRRLSQQRTNTKQRAKPGQAIVKLLRCFDGDDGREYVPGDIVALPRDYAIGLCHGPTLAEWIPTRPMDPLPPLPPAAIEAETAFVVEDRRPAKPKRDLIFQETKGGEVQVVILRSGCEVEGFQYALGDVISLPPDQAEKIVRSTAAEFYRVATAQ
jgi:hypothetical protein